MSIALIKYLSEWGKRPSDMYKEPGPVVTISREMGCPGKQVSSTLIDELNRRYRLKNELAWRWLAKEEILQFACA